MVPSAHSCPEAGIPGSSEQGGPEPVWRHLSAPCRTRPWALCPAHGRLCLGPFSPWGVSSGPHPVEREGRPHKPRGNCVLGGPVIVGEEPRAVACLRGCWLLPGVPPSAPAPRASCICHGLAAASALCSLHPTGEPGSAKDTRSRERRAADSPTGFPRPLRRRGLYRPVREG